MTNTAPTAATLYEEIIATMVEAGFVPMDDLAELAPRAERVLGYFAARGWDAYRPEVDGFTLARWSDDGIKIEAIDANGVTHAQARFDLNAKGLAWMAAALAA